MIAGADPAHPAVVRAKRDLRQRILIDRATRPTDVSDAIRIREHLLLVVGQHRPRAVAAHIGMPGEAPTLDFVMHCPVPVWLPVVRDDRSMGWSPFMGLDDLREHRWGMQQPSDHGRDDLPDYVDMVVMPALAVDRDGHRLGRGGGYYDRALAGVHRANLLRVAVVPAQDLLDAVPCEPHDIRVDVVITSDDIVWCGPDV